MLPPKIDTSTDPQVGFRPPGTLDAAPLAPYAGRFGTRHAAHLLRRAGFGGSVADVARLASLGMGGAVDSMLHPTAPDADFPPYPPSDDPLRSEEGAPGDAAVVARPDAAHEPPARREDDAVLARPLRDGARQGAAAIHGRADQLVPAARAGAFSGAALRGHARSRDADLARQPREREGASERELRARGDGAVRARPGQLHRGRRQGSGARVHGLDARQEPAGGVRPGAPRRRPQDRARQDRHVQRRRRHRDRRLAAGAPALPRAQAARVLRLQRSRARADRRRSRRRTRCPATTSRRPSARSCARTSSSRRARTARSRNRRSSSRSGRCATSARRRCRRTSSTSSRAWARSR